MTNAFVSFYYPWVAALFLAPAWAIAGLQYERLLAWKQRRISAGHTILEEDNAWYEVVWLALLLSLTALFPFVAIPCFFVHLPSILGKEQGQA